ncbi:MAG: hypothetical protein ACFE89_02160 [Candidatus Hodarchaeota archaeon]
MNVKKVSKVLLVPLITGVFIGSLFVLPIAQGISLPILGPLILTFGNDEAINNGALQLSRNIPDAQRFSIHNYIHFQITLSKAIGEIFYVGHGTKDGLQTPFGIIPWLQIDNMVELAPAKVHYFAVCYSTGIEADDKLVFCSGGPCDAVVTATMFSMAHYLLQNEHDQAYNILTSFIETGGLTRLQNPIDLLGPSCPPGGSPFGIDSYTVVRSPCYQVGWTPYGLLNPPALHTHWDTRDITNFVNGVLGFNLVFTAVLGVLAKFGVEFTPPGAVAIAIAIVVLLFVNLWALSLNSMRVMEGGGNVEQYTPLDPINTALIAADVLGFAWWYFKTQSHWWLCHDTLAFVIS